MLTRRAAVASGGALAVATAGASASRGRWLLRTHPTFEVPQRACDTHVHVVGDPSQFPMSPQRDNTPPAATAADLREMLRDLNIDRVVIVTPDIYGTDNSATLDAIKQLGKDCARGVAWIPAQSAPKELDRLQDAGIRGFRLLLAGVGAFDAKAVAHWLREKFALAVKHEWFIEVAPPPDIVAALETTLAAAPVPIVVDTFGWIVGALDQPECKAVLSLIKGGNAYIKLSEPYRLSKNYPDYPDLAPLAHALVEANPERVLWGSGWPHLAGPTAGKTRSDLSPNLPIDPGRLLNLLPGWFPNPDTRHKILVENPERLYGF